MSPSSSSTAADSQSHVEMSYKDRLDKAAENARHPGDDEGTRQPSLAEKVVQYIPVAAKVLGTENPEQSKTTPSKHISGPPERPLHDQHIEEFVRDQHRSEKDDRDDAP
ncbi:hypothetical protein F4819DRAFT_107931 [Hypoxylon fuscum]|nr:hypothetical protein F4819DRAFT_107931 [Hypoxylon fuscum]